MYAEVQSLETKVPFICLSTIGVSPRREGRYYEHYSKGRHVAIIISSIVQTRHQKFPHALILHYRSIKRAGVDRTDYTLGRELPRLKEMGNVPGCACRWHRESTVLPIYEQDWTESCAKKGTAYTDTVL